jgi:hypothetical protein
VAPARGRGQRGGWPEGPKEELGFAEEEPKGLVVVDALAQTRHEAAAAAAMGWKQRLHRLSMSAIT